MRRRLTVYFRPGGGDRVGTKSSVADDSGTMRCQ